jgi:hypothetical protein
MSGTELSLTTTVSQNRHDPIISSSGRPDTALIGLLVASGRNAFCQPPGASIHRFALELPGLSIKPHRACQVRRTQAHKVKLRLTTGATGHDEGNDILIRSVNSCTRAPSLSKRSWIVSIVAEAHGVVLSTSRRKVSSNT